VGAVTGVNWSSTSFITAVTVIVAVLYLSSYSWCKMKNHSHWTSQYCWERVSARFHYKGCQYNKPRQQCTKVSILHLTGGYVNATINRKTRKWEPEIGTDGFSQTQQNPQVHWYGCWFGPARNSGSGFRTVQNPKRTGFPVHTPTAGGLPGPVVSTTYISLLDLQLDHHSRICS